MYHFSNFAVRLLYLLVDHDNIEPRPALLSQKLGAFGGSDQTFSQSLVNVTQKSSFRLIPLAIVDEARRSIPVCWLLILGDR